MTPPSFPAIVVLGRDTCHDTTRSRAFLTAHGVPFDYRRVDEEPAADRWIRSLNDGGRPTPTILIGDPQAPTTILREPSDEELGAAIGLGEG